MACPAPFADACVRGLAHQILSRSEYARWQQPDLAWLQRLVDRFAHFFGWLSALRHATPYLYWSLLIGLALLAVLLLAHVAWSIRVALAARPEPVREAQAPPSRDFAGEAAELARQGRTLEAAHRLELACIELLLQAGAVELRRHQPNRVLRRRIEGAQALSAADRGAFLDLLDRLEARWFRDRDAAGSDDGLYDGWRMLHRRLLGAVQAP